MQTFRVPQLPKISSSFKRGYSAKVLLEELWVVLGPVNTTPETELKTHQMFCVHTTPEEFKNATITGHFEFMFEENSIREFT